MDQEISIFFGRVKKKLQPCRKQSFPNFLPLQLLYLSFLPSPPGTLIFFCVFFVTLEGIISPTNNVCTSTGVPREGLGGALSAWRASFGSDNTKASKRGKQNKNDYLPKVNSFWPGTLLGVCAGVREPS